MVAVLENMASVLDSAVKDLPNSENAAAFLAEVDHSVIVFGGGARRLGLEVILCIWHYLRSKRIA
jgi:hypothetical protein